MAWQVRVIANLGLGKFLVRFFPDNDVPDDFLVPKMVFHLCLREPATGCAFPIFMNVLDCLVDGGIPPVAAACHEFRVLS